MNDWIDKLRQDYQLKEAARVLMPALLKQIEHDVRYFTEQFSGRRRFKGPEKMSTGAWYLITDTFPAYSLEYRISETTIVFERETWATSESAKQRQGGIIQLKAEIDKDAWFEYQGQKFLDVEDVSRFLLEEFLQKMVQ